jgi:hypothetical protein
LYHTIQYNKEVALTTLTSGGHKLLKPNHLKSLVFSSAVAFVILFLFFFIFSINFYICEGIGSTILSVSATQTETYKKELSVQFSFDAFYMWISEKICNHLTLKSTRNLAQDKDPLFAESI